MHPLGYLFDDIYRNHWGIPVPGRPAPERDLDPERIRARRGADYNRQRGR